MKNKKIIITLICLSIIVGIIICVVLYKKDIIFNNVDLKLSKSFTDGEDNNNNDTNLTLGSIDINFIDNGIEKVLDSSMNFELEMNNQKFQIGREYQEEIRVKNNQMDSFIRVIIYKRLIDANGKEDTTLDVKLIDLGLASEEEGWILDSSASTDNRIVLYYKNVLGEEDETTNFMNYVKIDSSFQNETVMEEKIVGDGYKIINISKKYNGYKFNLDIEAQAVQTHNAKDAIKSAWGADVILSEDGRSIISVN